MSSRARAPRDQGCGPVLSTICRALRCSTHESFQGFADGSPGRSSRRKLVSHAVHQFVAALLVFSCVADLANIARLPKLKPKFQFRVSVRIFRHLNKQQAAAISAQHGPGLVATDGHDAASGWSLPTLSEARRACPEWGSSGVGCHRRGHRVALAASCAGWRAVGEPTGAASWCPGCRRS